MFQQRLGGLTVDGFLGEFRDDREGGFVRLEEMREGSWVDGETGDPRGHSVGSRRAGVRVSVESIVRVDGGWCSGPTAER